MISSFIWITLYLHKYYEVGNRVVIKSIFCTAYIVKMALTAGICIFLMFLAISRVYLGEHSYNEVLFGGSLGATLAFILHFFAKNFIKKLP